MFSIPVLHDPEKNVINKSYDLIWTWVLAINAADHYKKLCRRHYMSAMLRFGVNNFVHIVCDSGP